MATRIWVNSAINTRLQRILNLPRTHICLLLNYLGINATLYLKDELTHPTGSLKHRLGRSLFLYGLANGWITEGKPVIESSSDSTTVSEVYFEILR